MNRIDRQILEAQKRVRDLQKQKAAQNAAKKQNRSSAKKGRPAIKPGLLKAIELEAYTKPLADVALKFDVGLRTLYKYGIKRKTLIEKAMKGKQAIEV